LPNGEIYIGSWANDKVNGIGLQWYPDQALCVGYWKDDLKEGLQIIVNKATGKKGDFEYKDDFAEGLSAEHISDGIIW
jgi:hypothetical protein